MSSAQGSAFCAAVGDMRKFLLYMDADMPMSEIGNRHPYYNNNYAWVRIIDDGIAAWNDSGANVSITTSSSSDNTIEPARYNDTWYGLTTQTCTVAHEFGHVFWLCDNPNTTKPSLIKHSRDRNTMMTPQQFDIDNVNAKY